MKVFVVMDIGCLECQTPSSLFGLFNSKEEAEAAHAKREGWAPLEWYDPSHKDCDGGLSWYGDGKTVGYEGQV